MKLTLQATEWIAHAGEPTASALAASWEIRLAEACMLLLRAHRRGYLSREREDGRYVYWVTPSGERALAYARG